MKKHDSFPQCKGCMFNLLPVRLREPKDCVESLLQHGIALSVTRSLNRVALTVLEL